MRRLVIMMVAVMLLVGCASSTELLEKSLTGTVTAPQAVGDTGSATNTPTAALPEPSATPTAVQSAKPSPSATVPAPTSTAAPKPSPTAEILNVELHKKGFGADGRSLAYAFVVNNPNSSYAVENSQYQVAAYDGEGLVLGTDSGYIELLLPQQELGIAGDMYLESEDLVVDHVDVQIKPGDFEPAEFSQCFTTDKVRFAAGDYSNRVTGVVGSPYGVDLESIKVYAVAYSAEEAIIGGGYTYIDFIPAGGHAAASLSVTTNGVPTRVEMYGSLSGLTILLSNATDSEAADLEILQQGYGQDGSGIGYAFVIENVDQTHAIEDSQFQVAAYDAEGFVVGTDSGYIELVLPSQTMAVAGETYLVETNAVVDHLEVQILPGDVVASEQRITFTSENVSFAPDDYFPKVTGVIVSPYGSDITDLKVYAVAYNAEGAIIGGGYTFLDFVPAEGKAAVEVSMTVDGTPASVELYATVSGLSE